jgi:hypothetical protein
MIGIANITIDFPPQATGHRQLWGRFGLCQIPGSLNSSPFIKSVPKNTLASKDFTSKALDFTPMSLDFALESLDFTSAFKDFAQKSVDFASESLDFTPASKDFTPKSLDFKPKSVDNTAFWDKNASFSMQKEL